MSAGLEKARLVFLESSKKGPGGRTSVNGSGELVFGFNPKDYTIAKSAEWKRTPTKGATQVAMPEFVGAQGRTLTVEMFMDASEDKGKDVGKDVETLMACLVPRPSSIAKDKPLPPFVQFVWGKKVHFNAYVKTVSAKFTMFHPDGRPTRAVCQVTLEEVPNGPGNQNPTSGSLEAMRSHTVVAGDTLASLAYAEYGDPTRWRVIADANRIEDPLRMRPGTRLLVPAADSSPGAQP
jgi:nucleoid-associated protein YgaU